jgi:hypothetical protein
MSVCLVDLFPSLWRRRLSLAVVSGGLKVPFPSSLLQVIFCGGCRVRSDGTLVSEAAAPD